MRVAEHDDLRFGKRVVQNRGIGNSELVTVSDRQVEAV